MAGGPFTGAVLAAAPIVLILLLMLGPRWSAARAGCAGLATALVLAPLAFDFGRHAGPGLLYETAGVFAEGAFTSATILWILWPALALHHHQQRSGALAALQRGLQRLSSQPWHQAMLVGWFMALFFEGVAGFGTPVALAAPMLVALGVPPVKAVVLALLGHAVGVSFGALGTPVFAQAALTGLGTVDLAWRTALLHTLLGGLLMAFFVRTLHGEPSTAGPAGPAALAWGGWAAAAFLLPCLAVAALAGPELATLVAALVGAGLYAFALRVVGKVAPQGALPPGLARALWPHALLVLLVLSSRMLPPVAAVLGDVTLQWQWLDRYGGQMQPLSHPGTLLFLALVAGARLQGATLRELGASLGHSARRLGPVMVALVAMLCLSRLMLHAGMVTALERAAVQAIGQGWPLVAPAAGALGSFVTGSATASNVLFSSLQAQTAQALGMPVGWIVAAQGFGAAVGNIVCPHNIVAGAATVDLTGREPEILRRTLLPCLAYLALGGLLLAWLVQK